MTNKPAADTEHSMCDCKTPKPTVLGISEARGIRVDRLQCKVCGRTWTRVNAEAAS